MGLLLLLALCEPFILALSRAVSDYISVAWYVLVVKNGGPPGVNATVLIGSNTSSNISPLLYHPGQICFHLVFVFWGRRERYNVI